MSALTILLLKPSSDSGLGGKLCRMLAGGFDRVAYREGNLAEGAPDLDTSFRSNHQVVGFFEPPGETATQEWRKGLHALAERFPLMAVVGEKSLAFMNRFHEWGVTDFLVPPLERAEVITRVNRVLGHHVQAPANTSINNLGRPSRLSGRLIGGSPTFLEVLRRIPVIADCRADVLISGETGTGKELVAREIHEQSDSSDGPMVPVNCGAIPAELVENELFGHERGAYTHATENRRGLVSEANNGTLFLDEIDSLPLLAQVKLLRFLQEREYRPLGSTRTHKARLRVIAATNTELEKAVREGLLRRDLYYRLNVASLELPPLRARREDIPVLTRHFLARCGEKFGMRIAGCSEVAMGMLMQYDWPGNVRELEFLIERAAVFCRNSVLTEEDLAGAFTKTTDLPDSFREAKARVVAEFEQQYITGLLRAFGGNISRAARAAHKNRRAFWQLIQKHEIDPRQFR